MLRRLPIAAAVALLGCGGGAGSALRVGYYTDQPPGLPAWVITLAPAPNHTYAGAAFEVFQDGRTSTPYVVSARASGGVVLMTINGTAVVATPASNGRSFELGDPCAEQMRGSACTFVWRHR